MSKNGETSQRTAVYAGTFDPITLGHLDVMERGLKIFDRLIVAVTTNPCKKPMFSLEERAELIRASTRHLKNLEVKTFSGLLVGFLRRERVNTLLRGLREVSDFEREFQQATMNRKLSPLTDTVFIMTGAEYFYLSSSAVREIAAAGGNVNCLVPKPAAIALKRKTGKTAAKNRKNAIFDLHI
ncbi:MAG: pantetheine-phosphate adenylyltransferase [Candidatus Diapherotrites archaeon]